MPRVSETAEATRAHAGIADDRRARQQVEQREPDRLLRSFVTIDDDVGGVPPLRPRSTVLIEQAVEPDRRRSCERLDQVIATTVVVTPRTEKGQAFDRTRRRAGVEALCRNGADPRPIAGRLRPLHLVVKLATAVRERCSEQAGPIVLRLLEKPPGPLLVGTTFGS